MFLSVLLAFAAPASAARASSFVVVEIEGRNATGIADATGALRFVKVGNELRTADGNKIADLASVPGPDGATLSHAKGISEGGFVDDEYAQQLLEHFKIAYDRRPGGESDISSGSLVAIDLKGGHTATGIWGFFRDAGTFGVTCLKTADDRGNLVLEYNAKAELVRKSRISVVDVKDDQQKKLGAIWSADETSALMSDDARELARLLGIAMQGGDERGFPVTIVTPSGQIAWGLSDQKGGLRAARVVDRILETNAAGLLVPAATVSLREATIRNGASTQKVGYLFAEPLPSVTLGSFTKSLLSSLGIAFTNPHGVVVKSLDGGGLSLMIGEKGAIESALVADRVLQLSPGKNKGEDPWFLAATITVKKETLPRSGRAAEGTYLWAEPARGVTLSSATDMLLTSQVIAHPRRKNGAAPKTGELSFARMAFSDGTTAIAAVDDEGKLQGYKAADTLYARSKKDASFSPRASIVRAPAVIHSPSPGRPELHGSFFRSDPLLSERQAQDRCCAFLLRSLFLGGLKEGGIVDVRFEDGTRALWAIDGASKLKSPVTYDSAGIGHLL